MDPITAILFMLFAGGSGSAAAVPRPSQPQPQPRPQQPRPQAPQAPQLPKAPVVPPKTSTPVPVGPGVSIPPSLTDTTFPGPRWELDSPPSAAVQARAVELLPVLWAKGVGSAKIEDMGPRMGLSDKRPTAFKAERHGEKKAVSAWRLKSGTVMVPSKPVAKLPAIPLSPAGIIEKDVADAVKRAQEPQITDEMVKRHYEDKTGIPAESVRPVTLEEIEQEDEPEETEEDEPAEAAPSIVQLPVLRIGSSGPDVSVLQQMIGDLDIDGKFGPKTQARVIAYQRQHGLQVDGVVGPQTWGHLFSEGDG